MEGLVVVFKKDNKIIGGKVVDTLIGAETIMSGELRSQGIVRIEGNFIGKIFTKSDVVIGEKAVVTGDVVCLNATIAGRLEGNIEAEKKVDIYATGALLGDMKVGSLMMEDGAYFLGKCHMSDQEGKAGAGAVRTTPNIIQIVEDEEKGVIPEPESYKDTHVSETPDKEDPGKKAKDKHVAVSFNKSTVKK